MKAANRAVDEARRSADTANKALAIAQGQQAYLAAQHQQGLFMAVEAIRARIDAEMPRVTIANVAASTPSFDQGSEGFPENDLIPQSHGSLKGQVRGRVLASQRR